MKKIIMTGMLCISTLTFAQVDKEKVSFDLTQIPVSQSIGLLFSEVLNADYVIDPEVLTDNRLVSFRYKRSDGAARPFAIAFLKSLGYTVENRSGIDYVKKTKMIDLVPEEIIKVYRPRFRDAGYIARVLGPLFKGRFTLTRSVPAIGNSATTKEVSLTSAAGIIEQDADVLVFTGIDKEVKQLEALYPQIDISRGEVSVKAVIYEVSSGKTDGSAFQMLVNLLKGRIGITFNANSNSLGNAIKFSAGGFDAVLSAIATDSRFKVLTQPRLRVRSGETSRLVVGQDVPILGAVTYQQGGTAVQSVQYQSSGTILSILPTVHEETIDIKVSQQLSNFVSTTTGVNGSPTLIKRELETAITAKSGDVIVLGGLTETKTSDSRTGFSFFPNMAKQSDGSIVDVLVLLQLEKI